MSYLPVPSMQTGGLWWFTDLTAADPYFILPLAVTGTMFAIIEVLQEYLRKLITFFLSQYQKGVIIEFQLLEDFVKTGGLLDALK